MSDRYMYEIAERENRELGKVIGELRREAGVLQKDLYAGLCTKEIYLRLEGGGGTSDELLEEQVLSRLHMQYRLLDVISSDEDFWKKECRFHINQLIETEAFEEAWTQMGVYRSRVEERHPLHKQYLLWKEAQILEYSKDKRGKDKHSKDKHGKPGHSKDAHSGGGHGKKERAGLLYREALELTMEVSELERRLQINKPISAEEFSMYLGYRRCASPCSLEEYEQVLREIEGSILSEQKYPACYFETALSYVQMLYEREGYGECAAFCEKLLRCLNDSLKTFYLPQFHFLRAKARKKLPYEPEELADIKQEFRMAYYVALSFGEEAVAEAVKVYCEEEYGWHIINAAK